MREGLLRTQALLLALCDALMVMLAMQLAWWLRFDVNAWLEAQNLWHPFATGWTPLYPYVLAVFVTLPLFWLVLREMDLYSDPESDSGEFFRICAAGLVASILLAAISSYIKGFREDQQFQYSRGYSALFLPSSVICIFAGRWIFRRMLRMLDRKSVV